MTKISNISTMHAIIDRYNLLLFFVVPLTYTKELKIK